MRYQELAAQGHPEKILEEFDRDTLVRQASVLFPHHEQRGNLHLYSDREFASHDARRLLGLVETKLKASTLYDEKVSHAVLICNDSWREKFFLNGRKLGGLNTYPTSHNVFLTKAAIASNALISPRGRPIAPPRTLAYYMAHEITHTLIGLEVGPKSFNEVPIWLFEGYPDWVGLGPGYTYDQALKSYKARPDQVRGTMAEDYMRYGAQVAWCMDSQGKSIEALLKAPPTPKSLQ